VKNMPAAASLKEIDPTVDFVTGERRSTEFVADGLTDVLVGDALGITCDDNALIGFSLDVKKDDTVGYNYYCDDTGAPMENKNHRVTDNSIEPESGVGQLSVFDVDCSNVGLNYVLTYLKMKEMDSGNYAYSYGCATYELGMLTCAQFYTDLAAESDIDHSVSTLRDHPVQCFEGSALQKFRYQRVDDEVRYSYMCCTKAHIPTPSPTPLPTMEPSPEPTLEPVAKPTNEPVAKATMMPVAENTNAPTDMPVAKPSEEPTEEPVASPTKEPHSKPTAEPVADQTPEPSREPVALHTERPSDAPIAVPTEEPSVRPTEVPIEVSHSDPIKVEAEHLPRYCPFTFLKGTSELEILPGCVFISQDQLIYMRDEETSPSVYVCSSSEVGDLEITSKDLARYGLLDMSKEGTVSDIRVGANTKFDVFNEDGGTLFTVTPEDMRLVKERDIKEQKIMGGMLSTTVSVDDVAKVPDDCGDAVDNASAAAEGNLEQDDDNIEK